MTLNKAILGTLIIIASAFCVLVFGNPQWSGAIYAFRVHLLNNVDNMTMRNYEFPDGEKRLRYPSTDRDYVGLWSIWDESGNRQAEHFVDVGFLTHQRTYYDNGELFLEIQILDSDYDLVHGDVPAHKNDEHSAWVRRALKNREADIEDVRNYRKSYYSIDGKLTEQLYKSTYFNGHHQTFDNKGKLKKMMYWQDKDDERSIIEVFNQDTNLDRRAEFGIEVE